MCGRYFWTNDAEDALEEAFPELVGQILQQAGSLRAGDYARARKAMALVGGASGVAEGSTGSESSSPRRVLAAKVFQWGFPGFDKGKLLINARAESVKDRPTFSRSFEQGRCVLPAAGFYEWDKSKEKVTFTVPDRPILYLAGIWRPYGPEKRFVILTREANASMAPVHDRMPLILTREEVAPWVGERAEAERLLVKELPMLKAERPYEQLTFEW